MEEEKKEFTFEELLKALYQRVGRNFSRVKSVGRSLRRGTLNPVTGQSLKRPFNNRKPTKGRKMNEFKKKEYARIKARNSE